MVSFVLKFKLLHAFKPSGLPLIHPYRITFGTRYIHTELAIVAYGETLTFFFPVSIPGSIDSRIKGENAANNEIRMQIHLEVN